MWLKIQKYFNKHKLIGALIATPVVLLVVILCVKFIAMGVAQMKDVAYASHAYNKQHHATCMHDMAGYQYNHYREASAIREGKVQMKVRDIEATLEDLHTIAAAKGGFLETTYLSHKRGNMYGKVTLRVPVSAFSDAFVHVKGRASRLLNEWSQVNDLGGEAMGVDARLGQLVRYDGMSTGDEIVVLQQQARELGKQMALAAIYVEMWEDQGSGIFGTPEDPMVALEHASESTLDDLRSYSSILIQVVLKLPIIMIWVLTLGVIWFVVRRFGLRLQRVTRRAPKKK